MEIDVKELVHKQSIPVDTKPWSSYTEADYTLQQWHDACLIHLHSGPPTSKAECKLPVKTPNGVVNRNGLFAAAASLAGARTNLQAPAADKEAARKALLSLYGKIGQTPPHSLFAKHSAIEKILEHHGIKGMKWGVRHDRKTVKVSRKTSADFRKAQELRKRHRSTLTNKQLQSLNTRLNLEQQHAKLNPTTVERGRTKANKLLATLTIGSTAFSLFHSPAGKAFREAGRGFITKAIIKRLP